MVFGPVDTIAASIQLAVTPIFLLTGIGSFLNVLVHRLSRVVDRARKLESEIPGYPSPRRATAIAELVALDRRMALSNWAIALCTSSALLVCIVVAILFIGELVPMRWTGSVAILFIAAMALVIIGLLMFLLEVRISLRSVRIRAAVLTGEAVD
ncbi:DUF2721 domain-containing protein [Sandarakinorhabdus sp. DWP1-3-1]|uniref:DUF2721 domain-containing protein n=1 Tax=Sandarakinorhabdus sp. DWP1-3-1 TaxID=2804627 RepID=UPI003CF9D3F1